MECLLHRAHYSYGGREGGTRKRRKEGEREGGREGGRKGEREERSTYPDCIIEGPVIQILCQVHTQLANSICHWLQKISLVTMTSGGEAQCYLHFTLTCFQLN